MAKTKPPIKMGLVGIGRAGWGMHLPALDKRTDKFTVVAVCDVDPARRQKAHDRLGCRAYADIAELLADPEVELVDIATRSTEHTPHAIAALQAGKTVFLEKPIAMSYAQARKLQAVAEKFKGKLFIRHNRRFEPAYQHIREIMASKILGEVFEIKLRRHNYQRRADWQTITRCGGGQLLNWGPHIVDHGLRMLESPLAAQWSDLKKTAAAGDAEDHLKIILKGVNGRIVDLEISGGAAIREPEYILFGTKGALTCDGRNITVRYIDPKQKLAKIQADPGTPAMEGSFGNNEKLQWIEQTFPVAPKARCDTEDIWDHLYAAIRLGRKFPITLEEALGVMEVISAAKKGTAFDLKPAKAAKARK